MVCWYCEMTTNERTKKKPSTYTVSCIHSPCHLNLMCIAFIGIRKIKSAPHSINTNTTCIIHVISIENNVRWIYVYVLWIKCAYFLASYCRMCELTFYILYHPHICYLMRYFVNDDKNRTRFEVHIIWLIFSFKICWNICLREDENKTAIFDTQTEWIRH